jgi:HK97 family phage portal protein
MPFPELLSMISGKESGGPISLKEAGLSFNPVSVSEVDWYRNNGYGRIYSILSGGMPAWSGESVNVNSALNHSVVFACNRMVSESIGFLPAILMQESRDSKRVATEHPMYRAMKMAPNDEITAQCFSEMLTSHCLLRGDGYAQIIRRSGSGEAIELRPLAPEGVKPDREKAGKKRLVYVVSETGIQDRAYAVEPGKPHDILHIRGLGWNGINGFSVITVGRQSIGTAIAAEHNVANFWRNGGRVPYNLKLSTKFKDRQDADRFRADWQETYSVPGRVPILEPWLDYQQTGLSMVDAQALETRQWTVSEICRWFGVSPHLVFDLSRATFSNIEHLALEFVKMTLAPWLTRWEQNFWRCVLTPEEKAKGFYLKHNINAILRGDFKTRMEGYASALQNGHVSVDEVRELEDRDKLPNGIGGHYHIQTNMGTLKRDGEIMPANANTLRSLDEMEDAA